MKISRTERHVLGVGAAACVACCAGPIIGAIAGIAALGTAAALLTGALTIAVVAAAVAVFATWRRRTRRDTCPPPTTIAHLSPPTRRTWPALAAAVKPEISGATVGIAAGWIVGAGTHEMNVRILGVIDDSPVLVRHEHWHTEASLPCGRAVRGTAHMVLECVPSETSTSSDGRVFDVHGWDVRCEFGERHCEFFVEGGDSVPFTSRSQSGVPRLRPCSTPLPFPSLAGLLVRGTQW